MVDDSEFISNSSSRGGGIHNNAGTVTIEGSLFQFNQAPMGGGIYSDSVLTVADTTLTGNRAPGGGFGGPSRGGGIFIAGSATIEGSSLHGNEVQFGEGGGIFIDSFSTVTIDTTTLSGNQVLFGDGGGILNRGDLSIVASTIDGNLGGVRGGGIANLGTAEVTRSTIHRNSANGDGGGILNFGSLTLSASTISGNSGFSGGGIFNVGAATVGNTIVAGNSSAAAPDVSGSFTSAGFNLIGIGDGSGGFGATGDQVGTAASPIDPLLGPLQDNGGPTETRALLPGSPALDAGDPGLAGTTDQRGVLRPQGPGVDIGAFELEYVDLAVKPSSDGGPINLSSNGLIPIAILGGDAFDASAADLSNLSLIKVEDPTLGIAISPVQAALEDVNGDGLLDLVLKFSATELGESGALDDATTSLLLTGFTSDGSGFVGLSSVRIVGGRRRRA